MRHDKQPVFGKLFMLIFALFLITVLLSGGKAFATELHFTCYGKVCVSEEYEPNETETSELETTDETENLASSESGETEVEELEGEAGMAENTSIGVSTPVPRADATGKANQTSARDTTKTSPRRKGRAVWRKIHHTRRHRKGTKPKEH